VVSLLQGCSHDWVLTSTQILLLVYILYLLFQLKSHAYMYESTPQYKIDEESHPGVLADFLGSSTSSSSSSSSSDDSDDSSKSNTTAKRLKRRFKRRKRRKSSASSKDTPSMPSVHRSPNISANAIEDDPILESPQSQSIGPPHDLDAVESGDEADIETARKAHRHGTQLTVKSKDFGNPTWGDTSNSPERHTKKKHSKKHPKSGKKARHSAEFDKKMEMVEAEEKNASFGESDKSHPHVGFIGDVNDPPENSPRRPFNIRNLSTIRPALPKVLSSNVFTQSPQSSQPPVGLLPASSTPQRTSTIRRASSLPDRLNQRYSSQHVPPVHQPLPYIMPSTSHPAESKEEDDPKRRLSRTAAIMLLLCSTGLVAACAEFLVDSIDYLVEESGVSQAFIGLIILPIVGNAAEHVTAVTVASKNKMDLAIGVAVGSSIQIALFVTPIIVLLGWCLDTEMSLYFSLFETVSLFVSAFIVGFLILDGRSNYLEGALLIAAYVIIAVLAFFYPSCENLSSASGPHDASGSC
jgi:Ca2+:H+ antiporter